MAAPIHVKAKGKWKKVQLPPDDFIEDDFGNVVEVEELHDYEFVHGLIDIQNDENTSKEPPTENIQVPEVPATKTKLTYKQQKKLRDKEKRKKKRQLKLIDSKKVKINTNPAKEITENQDVTANNIDIATKRKRQDKKEKPKKKQKVPKPNYSTPIHYNFDELPPLDQCPPDMDAWKNLFVPNYILWALKDEGFTAPTAIQALCLPHAMRDRLDILGAAETGSGKTLAFSIPILHHVLNQTTYSPKLYTNTDSDNNNSDVKVSCVSDTLDRSDDSDVSDGDDTEDAENRIDSNKQDSDDQDLIKTVDLNEMLMEFNDDDGPDDEDDEDKDEDDSGVDNLCSDGDEPYDNPPTEEDYEEIGENEFGCVRVINNIDIDSESTSIDRSRPLIGLILEPTRELAIQVKNHLQKAAKYVNVKIATVVGGMAPQKQRRILRKCPEIIIATPGRLWELLQEGDPHLLKIPSIKVLVIDEADRMVEKGHFEELSKLFEFMKEDSEARLKRQTLVFSATLTMMHRGPSRRLKKKKQDVMTDNKLDMLMYEIGIKQKKKVIDLTTKTGTAETLTEARINCPKDQKDMYLYYFRRLYPGRTLVFANSKDCLRRLVSVFTELNCKPFCLHADMHQKQRLKNLEKFSASDDGFLLASDVAARGLDIPNVQHVIHYQVPRTIENYVHRSGRTARANKEGLSVMLISQDDVRNYRKIVHTLNRDEELPVFPVEYQYLPILKAQLRQALDIDRLNYRFLKVKRQNDWFSKAAEEMEIDIEDEQLLVDIGDSEEQRKHSVKLEHLRRSLLQSIKEPLAPKTFSGKYPTKMGRLVMPNTADTADALSKMKKDNIIQKPMIQKIANNPKVKRVKVNKQKEKKKKKLKSKKNKV